VSSIPPTTGFGMFCDSFIYFKRSSLSHPLPSKQIGEGADVLQASFCRFELLTEITVTKIPHRYQRINIQKKKMAQGQIASGCTLSYCLRRLQYFVRIIHVYSFYSVTVLNILRFLCYHAWLYMLSLMLVKGGIQWLMSGSTRGRSTFPMVYLYYFIRMRNRVVSW